MVSASVAFLIAGAVYYTWLESICGTDNCGSYGVEIVPREVP